MNGKKESKQKLRGESVSLKLVHLSLPIVLFQDQFITRTGAP